jgi:hypothetical protein
MDSSIPNTCACAHHQGIQGISVQPDESMGIQGINKYYVIAVTWIHGFSMDYGLSMDYPWNIHGLSMDNPWLLHG